MDDKNYGEDDEIDESSIFPEHLWGATSMRDSAEASLPWGSYFIAKFPNHLGSDFQVSWGKLKMDSTHFLIPKYHQNNSGCGVPPGDGVHKCSQKVLLYKSQV